MLSFNCEQIINIIKSFDFSQNLRPNMGLIDPSPLYLVQKETQCFYLHFWGLKILISKIVLFQCVCLFIKTLIA